MLSSVVEGADFVMVKPAGHYLDLVRELKDNPDVRVPLAVYQVCVCWLTLCVDWRS